jgi:GT2 family glycosyltransferase
MLDWDYAEERDVDAATGACLFVRRSAFESIGLFDERFFVYGEEIDWLVRAQQLAYRTRFCPAVEVTHLGRASTSAAAPILDRLLVESHYRYVRKHFGAGAELRLRAAFLAFDGGRLVRRPAAARRELLPRMRIHLGIGYERPT